LTGETGLTGKNEYPISNPSVIKEKEDYTGQARNDEG